jgi:hypothetical protein
VATLSEMIRSVEPKPEDYLSEALGIVDGVFDRGASSTTLWGDLANVRLLVRLALEQVADKDG